MNPEKRTRRAISLPLLAAGLALCAGSFLLDDAVIRWVGAHQAPWLQGASRFFSKWGDFPPIFVLLLLVLLAVWRLKHTRAVRVMCVTLASTMAGGLAANILRVLAGRARPSAHVAPGWYGLRHHGRWIAGQYQFSSFPSAHTAVAMACVAPLWLLLPRRLRAAVALPATLAALCIAASRVLLNAHHLSDVLASTYLGATIAVLLCRHWGQPPGVQEAPAGDG